MDVRREERNNRMKEKEGREGELAAITAISLPVRCYGTYLSVDLVQTV